MKILSIFSKVRVVIKWGAVVMAFIKAIEVLADELDKLKDDKDNAKA